MYTLFVKRIKEYKDVAFQGYDSREDSTISQSSLVNNTTGEVLWKGFFVENGGPSTDKSGQDKRIVARDYTLSWRGSSKNGPVVKKYPEWRYSDGRNTAIQLHTNETPGFTDRAILIHTGNAPQHSLGCLLANATDNKNGTCGGSVEAVHQLFTQIKKVGIENVILRIEEI